MKFRSLFISDTHLGSSTAQVGPLLAFMSEHEFDHIYVVGDFVDFWALRRRGSGWQASHNYLLQKLLKRSGLGVKVTWVVGNHDEFMQQFVGLEFGGIRIVADTVHVAADGTEYLVIHGHQLDAVMRYAPWLAHVGSVLYDVLLTLNRHSNWLRRLLGLRRWSLSRYVKARVKTAVNFVSDFETGIAKLTRSQGLSSVICGHIHSPADRQIDGVRYLNTGDHCESLSAVVEHEDGRMELVSVSSS